MKKSVLAVVVGGLLSVGTANAATDWGTHAPIETGVMAVTGSFSEIFNFTLTDPTATLSTLAVSSTAEPWFSFAPDTMVWLYKETGAIDTFVSAYSFGTLFSAYNLAAGDYYYKVTGTATGSLGGVFALTSTTAPVAVVPEADSYAMMLAGLGMLGLMAKRRMS